MVANQIALPDGKQLILPPARNAGAEALYKAGRLERLPQWLPAEISPARFLTAVAAEVNGLEANVDPTSIVRTAFNAAVLGLLPGQALGHCHFVPFKGVCTLIVGYKGFLELAYGCGFLRDVQCEVVLTGEEFERWNDADGAQILHTMRLDREEEWANVQAAYCIWHATTGGHGIEVVGRKQLLALSKRGNVWKSDAIEMAKKTPLRRAAKRWKLTGRMAKAVWLDEAAERGEAQPYVGDEPIDDANNEPAPSLKEYDVPSEPAEASTEPEDKEAAAAAAEYRQWLQQARTKADVAGVLDAIQADGRLLQMDRDALEALAANRETD